MPLSVKSLPADVLSDAQDFERQRSEYELKAAAEQFSTMKTVSGHHLLANAGIFFCRFVDALKRHDFILQIHQKQQLHHQNAKKLL